MTSVVSRGRVFTTTAAAEYCGVAVQTLYNHLSAGTGPKQSKQGRKNAFWQEDLDAWNSARITPVIKEQS